MAQVKLTDQEAYPAYVAAVSPIVAKYGGEYIARGGRSEAHEGTPPGDRNVLIRFPSYQAALDWYHSDEYGPVRALRMGASTGLLTIFEGVE